MKVVTLNSPWTSKRLGTTYPVGTAFIPVGPKNVWAWATPAGSHGQCYLRDEVPGQK